MTKFNGVIIEESLTDRSILEDVSVISTKVEPVTVSLKTPWVSQWTMHTVEISEEVAAVVAEKISKALDKDHDWYADFKKDDEHYIIYANKVFHITDRTDNRQYDEATEYGISIGIPSYQVDFSPHIMEWNHL